MVSFCGACLPAWLLTEKLMERKMTTTKARKILAGDFDLVDVADWFAM